MTESMKIVLPAGCGNAPRAGIVGELVTSWAKRDRDAVRVWFSDEAKWVLVGREAASDEVSTGMTCPSKAVSWLEIQSIITHGKFASCDGFMDTDAGRTFFSHVFIFASAGKSAKVQEVRTYLIQDPD